mgnify:CR=1 FL=1
MNSAAMVMPSLETGYRGPGARLGHRPHATDDASIRKKCGNERKIRAPEGRPLDRTKAKGWMSQVSTMQNPSRAWLGAALQRQ